MNVLGGDWLPMTIVSDDDASESLPEVVAFYHMAGSDDFLVQVFLGAPTEVTLYLDPEVPEEVLSAVALYVRESAFALTGHVLPVGEPVEVLIRQGEDLSLTLVGLAGEDAR